MVRLAYSHLGWPEVCLKAKVNGMFRKELMSCFKVLDGQKKRSFYNQPVETSTAQGYRVCRELLFLSTPEMMKMCGCTPGDIGLEEQQILDENNNLIKGVAIANNNFPLRRLQVYGTYSTNLTEEISKGDQMLRKDQNKEMHGYLVQEAIKSRPKALRGGGSGYLTWDVLQKKADDYKAKASLEPVEVAAAAAPAAAEEPKAPLAEAQETTEKAEGIAEEQTESEDEGAMRRGALAGVPQPKRQRLTKPAAKQVAKAAAKKRSAAMCVETGTRRRLCRKAPAGDTRIPCVFVLQRL